MLAHSSLCVERFLIVNWSVLQRLVTGVVYCHYSNIALLFHIRCTRKLREYQKLRGHQNIPWLLITWDVWLKSSGKAFKSRGKGNLFFVQSTNSHRKSNSLMRKLNYQLCAVIDLSFLKVKKTFSRQRVDVPSATVHLIGWFSDVFGIKWVSQWTLMIQ